MPKAHVMTPEEEEEMRQFYEEHDALCKKHQIVTLDLLFRTLAEEKFKIHNLFQTTGSNPFWRCNINWPKTGASNDREFEYGDGWTAEEAVENALFNARRVRRAGNKRHRQVWKKLRRDFCTGGTLVAKELDEDGH